MNFLIDTQALIWIRMGDSRVSTKAQKIFKDQKNQIFLSMASIWEMSIKMSLGKLELQGQLERFVSSAVTELGIIMLPISVEHIFYLKDLPFHHRDPFDRLLISQAILEDFKILGSDESFDKYSTDRVW